ncbi:ABC transporter permease subunit, partial [Vibrio parahaemolyticus]|nr:ABC transporter permease subunit [Vibrio parahaemolyticus]
YAASRSWKLAAACFGSLILIGYFGMWEDTMRTLSIITVCTMLAIALGIPIGIAMARSNLSQSVVTPLLDVMQTMPAFVYLIPVVMLLGIGKIPGLIAVVIYAIPPVIRLTNLGIRLVDKEVLEAATAFGASTRQRLFGVQLQLAMPTIMAGINQTIMMALSMVVIAALVGADGLGKPVIRALNTVNISQGFEAGLAIVLVAIILDRLCKTPQRKENS